MRRIVSRKLIKLYAYNWKPRKVTHGGERFPHGTPRANRWKKSRQQFLRYWHADDFLIEIWNGKFMEILKNGKTPRERKLHQSQKYMFWNTFNMCYCANPIVNASFMGVMEMYAVNIFPFLSLSSPFFPFLSFPFLSFCFLSCPFLFFLCFSLLVLPFISLSFFISYLLFDIDVSANVSLWLLPHAPTHVNASWSDFT